MTAPAPETCAFFEAYPGLFDWCPVTRGDQSADKPPCNACQYARLARFLADLRARAAGGTVFGRDPCPVCGVDLHFMATAGGALWAVCPTPGCLSYLGRMDG